MDKDPGAELLSNAVLELGLAVLEFQKIANSILPPEEGLKENWQYVAEDINDLKLGISIMEEHLDWLENRYEF